MSFYTDEGRCRGIGIGWVKVSFMSFLDGCVQVCDLVRCAQRI